MSTRCRTTCFQTSARTQDAAHANSQKTEANNSEVTSTEMRSSQIHKETERFPKVPFVSPHLHLSPGDNVTSAPQSFFEEGESEEVKVPIRLSTAFFLSWGLTEAGGVCYLKRGS